MHWSYVFLALIYRYVFTWNSWKEDKTVAFCHYNDVIMSAMASQITGVSIVCWPAGSDAGQRKHQSSTSLVLVRENNQRQVNSPHKRPVTRKMFPFDDVIMHFIFQARHAQEAGADAVACICPFYFKPPTLGRFTDKSWTCALHTARCRYNAVNFLTKRHPIAHQLWRGMGCLLWVHHLIDMLPQFLQLFMQYLTILDRVITALDGNISVSSYFFIFICWLHIFIYCRFQSHYSHFSILFTNLQCTNIILSKIIIFFCEENLV